MDYHVRCFMTFWPNEQYYGQNQDIVCDNVPILCIHMHLGMKSNVAGGSLVFRRTEKPFSIFQVSKTSYFVKQPPNGSFKMVPPHFFKILDHLIWTISQPGYLKPFCPLFVKKTNSCRNCGKSVRFELYVHDLMLMSFCKNHF